MKRALGLAVAGIMAAAPVAAQDNEPNVICTLAGTSPDVMAADEDDITAVFSAQTDAMTDMLGVPFEPSLDYLEENPYYDQAALEAALGGWVPFFDDPAANGIPRVDLCDTWIILPERLFD